MNINHRANAAFLLKSMLFGLGLAILILLIQPGPLARQDSQPIASAAASDQGRSQGPVSYADAVDAAQPSVVNVYIARVRVSAGNSLFNDPLFQHFFGKQFFGEPQQSLETNLGSGVIVGDGIILTNHHVIAGADRIQVALAEGRTLDAEILGTDPDTDLAVLRTKEKGLPGIGIGNSRSIRVGDVVLAIGNPFGIGQTVTQGIISATGRNKLGINTYENFIQTDAAINPGNSGGALVDAHGRLIGINTAIFSKSGGSQGIGFAIPVDLAMNIKEQILRNGRVVRGWLGLSGENMTPTLAKTFSLKDTQGVLVTRVLRNGPADQAGLLPGDIITSFRNTEVRNSDAMSQIIVEAKPGTKVEIQGWRGEHRFKFQAEIRERPHQRQLLD
jgi:serine protease DegS